MTDPFLMTTKEVAQLLRVHPYTLYRRTDIPVIRLDTGEGHHPRRYVRSAIEQWVKEHDDGTHQERKSQDDRKRTC